MRKAAVAREGFVLLVVLFVLVAMSALATLAILGIREFVTAASNRIALENARWHATDCAERARAVAERVLDVGPREARANDLWRRLDDSIGDAAIVRTAPLCAVSMRAGGDRLDINRASDEQVRRLLEAAGVPARELDPLRDAILDWRDPDTLQRSLGAEAGWYIAHHLRPPRDGPFASARELLLVRGVDRLDSATAGALVDAIDVERSRIDIDHASPVVLATLPGMTREAIAGLMLLRSATPDSVTLLELSAALNGAARDSMAAHYSELAGLTSDVPDAWILRASGSSTGFAGHVILELRLERVGRRVSVARRREWVE